MASGGQKPISQKEAATVAEVAERAIKYGLLIEWLMYYTGGIAAGEDPTRAALNAAYEWDL